MQNLSSLNKFIGHAVEVTSTTDRVMIGDKEREFTTHELVPNQEVFKEISEERVLLDLGDERWQAKHIARALSAYTQPSTRRMHR